MHKDLKKIIKALEEQGFTVTYAKGTNHPIIWKDGRRVSSFSGTPSDHRAVKNGLAYCKKAGFQWPPKR